MLRVRVYPRSFALCDLSPDVVSVTITYGGGVIFTVRARSRRIPPA